MMTRQDWLERMLRIAGPVARAAAAGTLREALPTAFHHERAQYFAPLEALGRTACGVAPWLEARDLSPGEEAARASLVAQVLEGIDRATDPGSPSAMTFDGRHGGQPLVDAAFLCHALLRAPQALAGAIPPGTRARLIACLRQTREITPPQSNWLLFAAMVEAGLRLLGETDIGMDAVLRAFVRHEAWYKGDGVYGDGEMFHWDYYNSFVIQPMLVDLARFFADVPEIACREEAILRRARRYAQIQERLIAPDGTYPVIGRSVAYRFGAFQLLAQAALEGFLPEELPPAQVRCALGAAIRRSMDAPGTFDAGGWLTPGVCGTQPSLAEPYINVGSLYLCTAAFLPLGLPEAHAFWSSPDEKWTSARIWSGEDVPADHAIEG